MANGFEASSIKRMSLANRFVRSATWEGLADQDGAVAPKLTDMMTALAEGDVGLIISGYAFVSPEGQSGPGQLAVTDDRFLPGLTGMANAVHDSGGRIALQIVHGGCFSNPELTGQDAMGPSANTEGQPPCRAASREEIARIVSDFTKGAIRAKQAGFDAIQIHAAHGFLLSEFLSPAFNRRTDEYGGSLENRARMLLDVTRSIRREVGPDYPLLVKLNAEDYLEGGLTREEAVDVAVMLQEASIDAIEYSGGTVISPVERIPPRPGILKTAEAEVYYREAAALYKQKVSVPLILVGGIRSLEVAEELIQGGTTDYVSLSRPLISEPGLIRRWKEGDRRKAECISCNACFAPGMEGRGIYCVGLEKKRSKTT